MKIYNVIPNVKSFKEELARPKSYVVKKELFAHPLISHTLVKAPISPEKKVKKPLHEIIHKLLEFYIKFEGQEYSISNVLLMEQLCCGYRSVTRYLSQIKERTYISVRSVLNKDGEKYRTTNYITVNILSLYEEFGEYLFKDLMPKTIEFLRRKILELSLVSQNPKRPIWPTTKHNINIINSSFMNDEKEGVVSVEENVTDPLKMILSENEPEDRSYFNRDIRVCPEEWRSIALKEGMLPEYVEEEFIDFRDYWLGQGKIKFAKKANWTRTWLNRIRDVLNNYRTSYKAVKKKRDFISSDESTLVPIKVDEITEDLLPIYRKIRDEIDESLYRSYIHKSIINPESDGSYTIKFIEPGAKICAPRNPMINHALNKYNIRIVQ